MSSVQMQAVEFCAYTKPAQEASRTLSSVLPLNLCGETLCICVPQACAECSTSLFLWRLPLSTNVLQTYRRDSCVGQVYVQLTIQRTTTRGKQHVLHLHGLCTVTHNGARLTFYLKVDAVWSQEDVLWNNRKTKDQFSTLCQSIVTDEGQWCSPDCCLNNSRSRTSLKLVMEDWNHSTGVWSQGVWWLLLS